MPSRGTAPRRSSWGTKPRANWSKHGEMVRAIAPMQAVTARTNCRRSSMNRCLTSTRQRSPRAQSGELGSRGCTEPAPFSRPPNEMVLRGRVWSLNVSWLGLLAISRDEIVWAGYTQILPSKCLGLSQPQSRDSTTIHAGFGSELGSAAHLCALV